ncbi:rRNA biogenesis protein rrp5 [Tissierella creatinophila]|uniref:rRNA biogenesis protein rrp5 n=1 Tax=Tissierella creatinophila DSM 6911 TaxID=1123403 RepID=A0A1U7M5U4_TISCR|nr:rRNA biogenesis protein rrp5 [Tissierella creatinophila]OLS02589.1 hypothetical protein TICRE_13900 [Tissierella creatinophila DSM 6911]
MSRMKLAMNVVKDLRSLADSIEALATDEQHVTDVEEVREPATKITFEDLRAVLAVLTRDGKQKEVKKLIIKYGAKKLSDVPEDKYQELLDEARKI